MNRTKHQYFRDHLELPLPTSHEIGHSERLCLPELADVLVRIDQALKSAQCLNSIDSDKAVEVACEQ